MSKIRTLNEDKYNISKHRFKELYYFCLQYDEWKDELKYKTDNLKSQELSNTPISHSNTSAVENLAIRRQQLESKCKLIEQTAMETDSELYQYIIKAVTNEYVTYKYLQTIMNIPCSRNTYYDRRRKFYYLLSKKI